MKYRYDSFSLAELVQRVRKGLIALPEFQRPFVWEPADVLDLLDSVSNGWPIGSLLTLEGPQPFEIRKIEAGPEVHARSVKHYLLDGQQRVTSLFHVLTQSSDITYYVDLVEGSQDDPPDFRWVKKARGIPESASPWTFPVGFLMDDQAFAKAIAKLSRSEGLELDATRRARLGSLMDPEYRIPTIAMAQDIELEALTRIFENLNRSGVHLDAFDLMVAVLYPHEFYLRAEWDAAQRRFPVLDDLAVQGLEVLKVVALWRRDHDRVSPPNRASRRVTGVRQRDVLNTPASYIIDNWPRALSAYEGALTVLRREGGITDATSVPSSAMLLTASYMTDRGTDPRLIRRWYWQCIFDQRYAQGANTQVTADIDALPDGQLLRREEQVLSLAKASLDDQIRRNRILRLGLRGLAVRRSAPDPVSGEPLAGPVVDVPIRCLLTDSLTAEPTASVSEMLTMTAESLAVLRRGLRRGAAIAALVQPQALSGQGFFPEVPGTDLVRWIEKTTASRPALLGEWMSEELR